MAIKEDLTEIKKEIDAQEQFLESMIKGERFFRKYKTLLIVLCVAAIVALIGFYASKVLNDNSCLLYTSVRCPPWLRSMPKILSPGLSKAP